MTTTVGIIWIVLCVLTAGIEMTGLFRNRAGATRTVTAAAAWCCA